MTSLRPWLLMAAILPLAGCGSLDTGAHVATGLASHQVCSAAFVSKIDADQFRREAVDPELGPVRWLLRTRVDRKARAVTASLAGLAATRAVYRGPSGCLVLHGAPPPAPPAQLPVAAPRPLVKAPPSAAIEAALDRAFAEPAKPWRHTKAVVILHNGQIVGERYAPGYGPETAITGWSATKSVTNALAGVMVEQGRLTVDGPAPVAAWRGDSRRAISLDNLLRMTSGLDLGDSLNSSLKSAFDPSAVMLFATRDMAGFAEARPLAHPPGTTWTYADASPTLTSRILRDQAGGTEAAMLAFAHRELFDKIGMEHPTLEMDATGTPLGATHLWASARDWARLGQLFLDDGVVGGTRILPAGWAEYSARPTPGSPVGYGAGFWTNRGDSPGARRRIGLGMPADAYFARGHDGQYVVIVPSARLVVVRLGITPAPGNDIEGVARLVADIIAAVRPLPGG